MTLRELLSNFRSSDDDIAWIFHFLWNRNIFSDARRGGAERGKACDIRNMCRKDIYFIVNNHFWLLSSSQSECKYFRLAFRCLLFAQTSNETRKMFSFAFPCVVSLERGETREKEFIQLKITHSQSLSCGLNIIFALERVVLRAMRHVVAHSTWLARRRRRRGGRQNVFKIPSILMPLSLYLKLRIILLFRVVMPCDAPLCFPC